MEKGWVVLICIAVWALIATIHRWGSFDSKINQFHDIQDKGHIIIIQYLSLIAATLFSTMVFLMFRL